MILKGNLFLTGKKHVGKSTLLFSALRKSPATLGGFRVDRIFQGKRLCAFRIVDVSTGVSADISTARRGGWDVHIQAFETVGVDAVKNGIHCADIIIMDELGRFEIPASRFRQAVKEALDSTVAVIGVLKDDDNSFLNEIRIREDTEVLEVREENRDEIQQYVEDWLSRVLA